MGMALSATSSSIKIKASHDGFNLPSRKGCIKSYSELKDWNHQKSNFAAF
jgi:hypothetical protein